MAGCVVALGKEDVVARAAVERLVERDGRAHELLLDLAKAVKTRLDLKMVVRVGLSDSADDGDVVSLGADVVCTRNHGDVDVVLTADLRLRDIAPLGPDELPTNKFGERLLNKLRL